MANVKFSDFTAGAEVQVGDIVVGLRAGDNYQFSFPSDGIKDVNGAYLFKYASPGVGAVNYTVLTSSISGTAASLTVNGTDANIDLIVRPKGSGDLILDLLKWPQADGSAGTVVTTDGAGQLSFTAAAFPGAVGAVGTILRSNGTDWVATTATFADTYGASEILYSNGANIVAGLATANSAMLVTSSAGVPSMSATLTNGQIIMGSTGATPVAGTLTAGVGISIAEGAGSITISGTGSGIGWNEVTGTTQSAAADSGYVTNNAGLVTVTLPVTAAFGTIISIVGKGAGGWKIAQNAGQNLQVGSVSTTTGAGGSIASTNQFDSIDLICTTADTTWTTQSGFLGTLTIV